MVFAFIRADLFRIAPGDARMYSANMCRNHFNQASAPAPAAPDLDGVWWFTLCASVAVVLGIGAFVAMT